MQPKVSILVPVYNVEKYLNQCMDSIVKQTLKEIEVVCVNDGSTDHSLDILKSYAEKDSRIVIIDKENGGYGKAMNVAADRATGEYIGIVEPDDYVSVNMFEDLYGKASEHDLDFVKSDFRRFSTDPKTGETVFKLRRLTDRKEKYNVVFNPSETPDALRFRKNTWTGIYRRTFIEQNHIRHNETPGASYQDNGFWFQTFFFAQRAMILDTPYYMYRADNPNSSVKNKSKVYAINIEYNHIKRILLRHPEKWETFKQMFWYAKCNSCLFTLSRISNEYKKEYILYLNADIRFGFQKKEFDDSIFYKFERMNVQLLRNAPYLYYLLDAISVIKNIRLLRMNEQFRKKVKTIKEFKKRGTKR